MTIAEAQVLAPSPRPSVSAWAAAHYRLPETAAAPGPWSHDYTPYLVEIMDRFGQAGDVEIWVRGPTQCGKSELSNICLGYMIDQMPAATFLVMPREADASRRINTRVRPMFLSCPSLKEQLPGGRIEGLNIGRETVLNNGMVLLIGWAGSPASLADMSAGAVILDEVGKFVWTKKEEGDPISLIRRRLRWFTGRSRLLGTSTPQWENDLFDREWNTGDRRKWWVRCPHCGRRHVLAWENVSLDKRDDGHLLDPGEYETGGRARYVCPLCGALWSEDDRWTASREGFWLPAGQRAEADDRIAGEPEQTGSVYSYHVNALMLHPRLQSIDGLAAEWALANQAKRAGDTGPLQDFVNAQLAVPWKEMGRIADENKIKLKRRTDLAAGLCPAGCDVLVAGADYHEDENGIVRVDYQITAWGPEMVNHVIEVASVESLEEMAERTGRTFAVLESQAEVRLRLGFIDSGYKPDIVYQFCRTQPGLWVPSKGVESQRVPVHPSPLDKALETARMARRRAQAGRYRGLYLYLIDTTFFKDRTMELAERTADEAGATTYYADCPDWYFEELTAEHKVVQRRGRHEMMVWTPRGRTPSHGLDIAVLCHAAAYSLGLHRPVRHIVRPSRRLTPSSTGNTPIRTHY